MCGITGIITHAYQQKQTTYIEKLTDAVKHRGPNAGGIFQEGIAALGHRRLSIIDLSTAANQPFQDVSERYVLVFNGEIYNYREVRQQLPDYPFQTQSDTEVIAAAYAAWGEQCLGYFNGMFAFAIWDRQEQSLFVARDRLGIKPLYYYWDGQTLVFASEIRSLLTCDFIEKQIGYQGLQDYLRYQAVMAPYTIVQGIQQLMPGQYGVLKQGKWSLHAYWNIITSHTCCSPGSLQEAKTNIKDLFFKAVERRMVADVPLGAFLSGGIDSSAVVAAMAAHSTEPIHTFSISFSEKEFDESQYAELIAKKFGTKHTPLQLSPSSLLEKFTTILKAYDSPSGDGINTYLISEAVKQSGVTVALSGIGGDELFAGYAPFKYWYNMHKLPEWALRNAKFLNIVFNGSQKRASQKQKWFLENLNGSIADVYPVFRSLFLPAQITQLLKDRAPLQDSHEVYLNQALPALQKLPLFSQYSVAEITGYTQNVLLRDTDQMSMAHALEVREPFFDYQLVEYVLRIPDAYKYPTYPKSLFVEALKPLLPDAIVHRPKQGFSFPWKSWMHGELKGFCEARLKGLEMRELFDPAAVRKMREDFFADKNTIIWSQIMALVILEEWLRNNGF